MANMDQCHILRLNDDCFYEIYKLIPIIDWCSLRETCTRFRTISDFCFDRQNTIFQLKAKNVYGSSQGQLTLNDAKRLIRNFGQFVTKLSINLHNFRLHEDAARLLPLLDRYCHTLRDLKFVRLVVPPATIHQCDRLFSNLHRLAMKCMDKKTLSCCLVHCVSLKELEIFYMYKIEGNIPTYRIESLESFTMKKCQGFTLDIVKEFLNNNQQLKRVTLLDNKFEKPDRFMEDVPIALPNLEELSLRQNFILQPEVLFVAGIPTLKKLEMDFTLVSRASVDINRLLTDIAAHNSVEEFHLAEIELSDALIGSLCTLKTLKILKLTAVLSLDEEMCKKLACELPELSEIHFMQCELTTFHAVKEFVVHSTNLTRIVFIPMNYACPSSSLTEKMFLSLVDARRRIPNKKTLLVFLDDKHLDEIKDDFEEAVSDSLTEQANVIKLLPLDKQHRRTLRDSRSISSIYGYVFYDNTR